MSAMDLIFAVRGDMGISDEFVRNMPRFQTRFMRTYTFEQDNRVKRNHVIAVE